MISTEARIISTEAESQDLNQQLRNPRLSKQERHDIQQRIIENTKLLTVLYQQNAAAGENRYIHTDFSFFRIFLIDFGFFSTNIFFCC